MEGSREMMGNEVPGRVTKVQGKLSRTEFDATGTTGFLLITEKDGWSFFSMRSQTPNKLNEEVVANLQSELNIAGPLVNYAAKGYTIVLLGKDTVEGATCFKIKLTFKEGRVKNYFINAATFLLTKGSSKIASKIGRAEERNMDPTAESSTLYSDYKTVEGLLIPHTVEIKSGVGQGRGGGRNTFNKIEINIPVDAKLYKPG